jgi:hypothetical protein
MKIARVAADQDSNKPLNPVVIQTIKIVDPRKPAPKAAPTHKPGTTTHKSTTPKATPQSQ